MPINLRFHRSLQNSALLEPVALAQGQRRPPNPELFEHRTEPAAAGTGAAIADEAEKRRPLVSAAEVSPMDAAAADGPERIAPNAKTVMHADFAACYCAANHLSPEQYVASAFRRTLSVRALLLGFPVLLLRRGLFSADRAFLAEVGHVATMDQYFEVEDRFRRQCGRRSLGRDLLRLRVSTRRLRRLVAATFSRAR